MALTTTAQTALAVLTKEDENRSVVASEISKDMKNSQFFSQNWDNLLLAAPNCLEIMGNINLLASTRWAETTPLKGHFTHIKNNAFLKSALAELNNQGSRSFLVARMKMGDINLKSSSVADQITYIVRALADPEAPMQSVVMRLEKLKKTAADCHTAAKDIEDSMTLWAEYVYELHSACTNTSASTEEQKRKQQLQLELAKKDEAFRIEQEKKAQADLEKMGQTLKEDRETYKGALDDMPSGASLCGQACLMSLTEAAGTALNTFAASSNPVGSVGTASQGLTGLLKEIKDEGKNVASKDNKGTETKPSTGSTTKPATLDDKQSPAAVEAEKNKSEVVGKLTGTYVRRAKPKSATRSASADRSSSAAAQKAPAAGTGGKETAVEPATNGKASVPAPPQEAPEAKPDTKGYGTYDLSGKFMKDDPALSIAPAVATAVEQLKNIIVGAPEGIDWDAVVPKQGKDGPSATVLETASFTLTRLLRDFRPRAGGLASQLTVAALTEAIGIADEVEAEGAKAAELTTWVRPSRKSELYKDWDARISRCSHIAIALDSASQNLPGGVGTRGVSLAPQPTAEEKVANANYKQSVIEQTVKSATSKLQSTQTTYLGTLETYQKMSEMVKETSDSLATARREIAELTANNLNLEAIKKVLVRCIGYLIELKDRIRSLVVFFGTLASMIDICVKNQVMPFTEELEMLNKTDENKALLYGDFYRDTIFRMVLQIKASFWLYADVSLMYIEVDRQVIKDGILLVDKLALVNIDSKLSEEAYFAAQQKLLSDYNLKAEEKVHNIVKTKQDEIISDLDSRVKQIGQTIDKFPREYRPVKGSIEYDAAKLGANLVQADSQASIPRTSATAIAARGARPRVAG